jgi:adenine-specific DNA-methyltransferase
MGTKRELAPFVSRLIADCGEGPFLDLFAGTCSVASAVGANREIWSNDTQLFATEVARALTMSRDFPMRSARAADLLFPAYQKNMTALTERLAPFLAREREAIEAGSVPAVQRLHAEIPSVLNDSNVAAARARLARRPKTFPYRLFAYSYGGTYFGLRQSVQMDSVRFAIDQASASGRLGASDRRWLLLALCQSAARVATSTGHFAQYLKIGAKNKRWFCAQRKRSVWIGMLDAIDDFFPIGPARWRLQNRVFRRDAVSLLKYLRSRKESPGVIYADPPYTQDQYSRYYHIYETLLLYDYPRITGTGRYRGNRYTSQFSMKRHVMDSIEKLISHSASLSCELVLSYPENGLLDEPSKTIRNALKSHYAAVDEPVVVNHIHSSMGASKGSESSPVKELIFRAR